MRDVKRNGGLSRGIHIGAHHISHTFHKASHTFMHTQASFDGMPYQTRQPEARWA